MFWFEMKIMSFLYDLEIIFKAKAFMMLTLGFRLSKVSVV